jgi:ABC-2 type transport system permease protein
MVALVAVEKITFQTSHIFSFLKYRGMGWTTEAFAFRPRGSLLIDPLNPLAPLKFLSSPGLWIGLAFAAAFLAAAARLRRYRGPL